MTRRTAIVVVALVVAALVGVGLMIVPSSPLHQTPTLGLDLQGGLEITKQAVPPKGRKLTKDDLERVGVHAERGEESAGYLVRLYAGHDLVHLAQIERIKKSVAESVD